MHSSPCYISATDKWILVTYATAVYTANCQVRKNVVQISEKLTVRITGTDLKIIILCVPKELQLQDLHVGSQHKNLETAQHREDKRYK